MPLCGIVQMTMIADGNVLHFYFRGCVNKPSLLLSPIGDLDVEGKS
jgi:hypothetical protein